jgi:hypothetical protein
MPTAPPALTAAPTSPDRSDPATFSARAIALDDWTKNVHVPELQTAINSAYANAVAAAGSSAALAAIAWVSGTTYAIGDARYSPIDFQTYRRKTAGAGTTDPSLDGTNWARVNVGTDTVTRSARTSNTILVETDRSSLVDITSGTFSQTFTAAGTLGSGWYCYIRNSGTGTITLDPNASELINGAATLAVASGQTLLVQSDGTGLNAVVTDGVVGDHSVFLTSGNGHGSTNTKIRRFTTTQSSSGTAITYADSATLGATFTINTPGIYMVHYSDSAATAQNAGVSLNSAQLTTAVVSITAANRLGMMVNAAGVNNTITVIARLAAGDVLRAHTGGTHNDTAAETSYFNIRRIGA